MKMESKGRRVPHATGPTQRPAVAPAATEPFGETVTRNAAPPAEIAAQPETPPIAPAAVPDPAPPVETPPVPSPPAAPSLPPPPPGKAEPALPLALDAL